MGNPHQLTARSRRKAAAAPSRSWQRTALYGAGTVSMLFISMASSLSLWIALPWAFLGWSPTLVTSGSMEPLVTPGDVVMIRPVTPDELVPNTVVLYDRPDTGRIMTTSPGVTSGSIEPEVTRVGDQSRKPHGRAIHSDRLLAMEIISMLTVPAP